LKLEATFVRSAAVAEDFLRDGLAEIAFVGRSNVGKSSLINALVRQRLARTSAAPGKTRLVNIFRIARGAAAPFYLVDLPGYGYARGGHRAAEEFGALTRAYFGRVDGQGQVGRAGLMGRVEKYQPGSPDLPDSPAHRIAAILLVDARHPGLDSDRTAWQWLQVAVDGAAVLVATKIDKLARGERISAMRKLESVFENSVLPVSAVTGEGLDQLWNLIDSLVNNPLRHNNPAVTVPPSRPRKKAPRPLKK
jgi:GTP-binding protein